MDGENGAPFGAHGSVGLPVRGSMQRVGFRREEDRQLHKTNDDMDAYMSPSMATTLVSSASSSVAPVPGTSTTSPHLEQSKSTSFVPPARPSSTPFPLYDARSNPVYCFDDFGYDTDIEMSVASAWPSELGHLPRSLGSRFEDLPTEVHEAILDHLFGYCISTTSSSAMKMSSITRRWGTALRHCRRKELSDLALVSGLWRDLVQQRLYRHVKLKATIQSIDNALMHLSERPHLACFVKHIEMWFPVFEPTYGPLPSTTLLALPTVTPEGLINASYTLPANNCTLDEVFRFVALALPCVQVLTLEGGERRKAPQIVYFGQHRREAAGPSALPSLETLPCVTTLVTRGQWNLIRDSDDFSTVLNALPNLGEWQATYGKPKSKSYITMAEFLPLLPMRISNFSLCLENDYRRESATPPFYAKVSSRTHICSRMAEVPSRLEHFSYTGRICHKFFDLASRTVNPLTTRLRSIDITVKNCCRHSSQHQDSGTGIQELGFIEAFERLVHSAVRSLDKFKEVQYLRIRFVDLGMSALELKGKPLTLLESLLPPLNPFFLYTNGHCSGVWDDMIVAEMARVRPHVRFAELSDTFGNISYSSDGRMVVVKKYPGARAASLKLANYRSLANRITIH